MSEPLGSGHKFLTHRLSGKMTAPGSEGRQLVWALAEDPGAIWWPGIQLHQPRHPGQRADPQAKVGTREGPSANEPSD